MIGPTGPTTTFGILLYDDVEVLDACGPFQVFTTAGRLVPADAPPPQVVTIAATTQIVTRHGMRILPDCTLDDHPPLDVLVVPGGVTREVEHDSRILSWIREQRSHAQLTTSVCTGAFLLAEAGVLDGRPATTHWEDEDELGERWPAVRLVREPHWVDDGDVITSAGISAGIDMSLHVVRRMFGEELAVRTARQMEYAWRDAP